MQKQRWVSVAAALARFPVSLDALVVRTALPRIRRDLGAPATEIGMDSRRVKRSVILGDRIQGRP